MERFKLFISYLKKFKVHKKLRKLIFSQIILGVLFEIWAYKKLRPLLKDGEVLKKAFKDYPEFARVDADSMKKYSSRVYLFIIAPFVFLKFLIGWGSLALFYL